MFDDGIDHSQSNLFFSDAGEQLVSHIALFENLDAELNSISAAIGVSFSSLEKLNTSSHAAYHSYYSSTMVDIVKRSFSRDIERFQFLF